MICLSRSDKNPFQKTNKGQLSDTRRNYNRLIQNISKEGIICFGGESYQFEDLCYNHGLPLVDKLFHKCTMESGSFFILNPL